MSQLIISTQLIVLELRKCRVAHITETVETGSEEMERQRVNEKKLPLIYSLSLISKSGGRGLQN